MITIKDINKAIVTQVTTGLANTEYNNIKFTSTDITEEIVRPCFYFTPGADNKIGMATKSLKERSLEVNLFYFAKDRAKNKLDLLTMQDYLENIFLNEIVVNGSFYFGVDEISFETFTKDGYMIATIQLYSLEEVEIVDTSELMEELNLNMEG